MSGTGMRAKSGATAIALCAVMALSACGGDGPPELMQIRSDGGPDEFGVLPPKALEMPTDLSTLPTPTPGGSNRTDPTPEADAIIALGGKPGAAGTIPAADAGLYGHASRFGTESGIRATLAAEDLEWRTDNDGKLLEKLFGINIYYKAYEAMSLDQHAELARWRKLGAKTPSAPPERKK